MIVTLWSGYVCLGVYDAEDGDDAREQMARRNGHRSFADITEGCSVKAFDEHEPPWNSSEARKEASDKLARWVRELRRRHAR